MMRWSRRDVGKGLLSAPLALWSGKLWAEGDGRLKLQAEDLERRIAGRTQEVFAAAEQEVVVVLAGVVDVALAPKVGEAPVARAMGHLDLVVDVVAATVTGEIYGLVAEGQGLEAVQGATLRVDGHMTQAGEHYGAWFEAPLRPIGRPTLGLRLGIRGHMALRGSSAPRAAYGPLAGDVVVGGSRQVLLGSAALWEVKPAVAAP